MNAVRTWPSSRWLRSSDIVLALVAGGAEILGAFLASRHQVGHRPFDALGAILLAVGALGLIVRRRYPEVTLAAALGTTLAYWTLDYRHGPIFLVLIIAFFSAALSRRRLAAWTSLAVGYATFPWLPYLVGDQPRPSAAFLHDISLINVQAGVALHLIDERPEQARTALAAIKHASKDALGELRSVLDVLRTGEEPSPRGPAPTLARLDELLSGPRASGLTVRTKVTGQPPAAESAGCGNGPQRSAVRSRPRPDPAKDSV